MHNLPLACINKKVGIFLGKLIGKVVEIDTGVNGSCFGKLIRARIQVDVTKPLMRGLRVMIGDPKELCVVLLRYERLHNFYYFRGKVGHLVRDCSNNKRGCVYEEHIRFGSWIRAAGPSGNRSNWGHPNGENIGKNDQSEKEDNVKKDKKDRSEDIQHVEETNELVHRN
ncbi:hypothetical protein ACOSQ3_002659 [Xanthoceras sorbifolium]